MAKYWIEDIKLRAYKGYRDIKDTSMPNAAKLINVYAKIAQELRLWIVDLSYNGISNVLVSKWGSNGILNCTTIESLAVSFKANFRLTAYHLTSTISYANSIYL